MNCFIRSSRPKMDAVRSLIFVSVRQTRGLLLFIVIKLNTVCGSPTVLMIMINWEEAQKSTRRK